MTRNYYEILEIEKTATQEEIKKSFRKLAQRWHPDKFVNKNSEKRQEANEKMKGLNKAYEVLGDKEKRKKYDLGETEFTSNYEEYWEEIERQERELEAKIKVVGLKLELLRLEKIGLDRRSAITDIGLKFTLSLNNVDYSDLDPKLWYPYKNWLEKVTKMEITIPDGESQSQELKKFREEMYKAIEETDDRLTKEKEKKAGTEVSEEKIRAIKIIEEILVEECLKVEDLGEYSNYQEQINCLDKIWKIRFLRDKIRESIIELARKGDKKIFSEEIRIENGENFENLAESVRSSWKTEEDEQPPFSFFNSRDKFKKEGDLGQMKNNHGEPKPNNKVFSATIIELKQDDLVNLSQDELIKIIKNLKSEIDWLKNEKVETCEIADFQSYINKKESQLKKVQSVLDSLSNSSSSQNKSNQFSKTPLIIGSVSFGLLLAVIAVYQIKKNREKS